MDDLGDFSRSGEPSQEACILSLATYFFGIPQIKNNEDSTPALALMIQFHAPIKLHLSIQGNGNVASSARETS
jgi:hypothetical protein